MLKVFGERHTGTKFLLTTLRANGCDRLWPGTLAELGKGPEVSASVPVDVSEYEQILIREALIDDVFAVNFAQSLGWKHSAVDVDRLKTVIGETRFLITTKNPYAWAASMLRRPNHNLLTSNVTSLEALLTIPWLTSGRDNIGFRACSLIEMWNIKYRSYLRLQEAFPTLITRYEDLLFDPGQVALLAAFTGVGRQWQLPTLVTNESHAIGYYQGYYAQERWRDDLTPACLRMITGQLDRGLVERLGYDILT